MELFNTWICTSKGPESSLGLLGLRKTQEDLYDRQRRAGTLNVSPKQHLGQQAMSHERDGCYTEYHLGRWQKGHIMLWLVYQRWDTKAAPVSVTQWAPLWG